MSGLPSTPLFSQKNSLTSNFHIPLVRKRRKTRLNAWEFCFLLIGACLLLNKVWSFFTLSRRCWFLWQCIIFYWVQWSSPYPCHVNALKYFILICIILSWILIVLLPTPFECSDSLCSFLWSLTDLRTLFHSLLHSIWLDCYSRSSWKTAWFIEVNCSLKRRRKKKKTPKRKCGSR